MRAWRHWYSAKGVKPGPRGFLDLQLTCPRVPERTFMVRGERARENAWMTLLLSPVT